MKDIVVITGSRKLTDAIAVRHAYYAICGRAGNEWLRTATENYEIEWHHGGAKDGVDKILDSHLRDWSIEPVIHLPDYEHHFSSQAPHIRNDEMLALNPRAVIAIWDGNSNGTRSVIAKAARKGIPVFVEVISR